MTTIFNTVRQSVHNALVRSGRARARTELLRLSERTLQDAGFSRALLESGVDAWPWRIADDRVMLAEHTAARRARAAEQELQRFSDAELDDLAIARADIPRAVREGRAGIDRPAHRDESLREAA